MIAATEPIPATQRQPSKPNGASEVSCQENIGDEEGERVHRLQKAKRLAADPFGDQFGKIGVHRDEFRVRRRVR